MSKRRNNPINKRREDCTWLLYVLTIEGSYIHDTGRPATIAPDTYQVWIAPDAAYDVRTYAIDKDVRVLRVEYPGRVSDPVGYFQEVALETYGDIIGQSYRIEARTGESAERLCQKVREFGLHPNVQNTPLGFPLWLPEDAKYWSQSGPGEP